MTNYKFKINGKTYEVSVNSVKDGIADVSVNGVNYNVEIENAPASVQAPAPAATAAQTIAASAPVQSAPASAKAPASTPTPALASASATASAPATGGSKITSPLPGVVIELCVKEGEAVKRGQKLLVLEAMKMENEIQAESDGTVSKLFVNKGDSVLEGADLALLV
ncbi:MAG: biotin/lipoyl-containing protein [Candidatus Cryptobacteroides sp.]|jgi:biotin carboxyl carrier protein